MHEVTLYLGKYRTKGRAANTIHFVCSALALLYCELDWAKVDLLGRLVEGRLSACKMFDGLMVTISDGQSDALPRRDRS